MGKWGKKFLLGAKTSHFGKREVVKKNYQTLMNSSNPSTLCNFCEIARGSLFGQNFTFSADPSTPKNRGFSKANPPF
jgi:hypothetical protein